MTDATQSDHNVVRAQLDIANKRLEKVTDEDTRVALISLTTAVKHLARVAGVEVPDK